MRATARSTGALFRAICSVNGFRAPVPPPSGSWTAGTAYAVGTRVTYNGLSYQCLQAHTAITGWEPPNTPSLWQRL